MHQFPQKPLNYGSRDRFLAESLVGFDLTISRADRERLRPLAAQVAELAARPLEQEKQSLWHRHNDLQPTRPLIFCDLEDGWKEVFPPESLECEGGMARQWEVILKREIFYGTQLMDDAVIRPFFEVPWVHNDIDWGVAPQFTYGEGRGSYIWDAPIKTEEDIVKLRRPEIVIDRAESAALVAVAEETFRDLLPVRVNTRWIYCEAMTAKLSLWRGLQQMMFDMVDNPELFHRLMAFLRDAFVAILDSLEEAQVLTLNNDGTYIGRGGFGWTKQLPQPDFAGTVRLRDLWGNSESQETVSVSPAMFAEFVFPYQLPILERFGLNCYGCCEPLNTRWHIIEKIPRLRRVSVPPAADLPDMAEKLGSRFILALKPSPADVSAMATFDEERIRAELRAAFRITRDCRVEVILKDAITIQNDPTRPVRWARIAQEEAARV